MLIWDWSKATEIVKFIQFMRQIQNSLSTTTEQNKNAKEKPNSKYMFAFIPVLWIL